MWRALLGASHPWLCRKGSGALMQRLAGGWNNGVLRGAGGFLETDDWHACVFIGVLLQTLFGHLLPLISVHGVEVSVLICLPCQAAQAWAPTCTDDITLSADAPTKVVSATAAPSFKPLGQVRVCRAPMLPQPPVLLSSTCLTMLSRAGQTSFRCCPSSSECP